MAVDIFPVWGKFEITSGGTGDLTLSRLTGFPDMADVLTSGEGFAYTITTLGGLPLETGIGNWTVADGLTRESITARMVAGEVDFTDSATDIPSGAILYAVLDANTVSRTAKKDEAQTFAETQTFSKSAKGAWGTTIFAATFTLDASKLFETITLTDNITFNAVSNNTAGDGRSILVKVVQDATGGRTAAFNTSVFKAAGATFPSLTTTGNAVDLLQFIADSDGTFIVSAVLDVRAT